MDNDVKHLQEKVRELERQLASLREKPNLRSESAKVIVPAEMKPLFDIAQKTVSDYFVDLKMEPEKGTIEINEQRYILVRASAMSKDFLDTIQKLYSDRGESEAISIGKNFLFDIAHTLGINDAKNFHAKMNLVDPIAKLSAGPIHFAYTGWAFVEILPESNPSPDDNFCLIYNHPFSFEADSWIKSGKKSKTAVCIMNAGYSSGWCEESFGIPLTAVEVSCIAKGDKSCTFIMSPPHMIQDHLNNFHVHDVSSAKKQATYEIPTFFERKKVEEEMQRSKTLAESSAKAKEDFVSNMSHELRTPLGSILGYTELLKKTNLSHEQADYLDAISMSGSSLLTIINDILDLSKLDAGKFAIENVPFNIPDLLTSVLKMFQKKATEKGLTLEVRVDPSLDYSVYGDPTRLTQILVNLIGNAVKFTEKGTVFIVCSRDKEDVTQTRISFGITDTGIGIPKNKLDTIFERFTQADTDITRRFGGTGLGLAISKQLIELLGGKIEVSSHEGKGSTFSFAINYQRAPSVSPIENENINLANFGSEKLILVAEDNPLNQKLTAIILRNNDFNFILADNGQQAVKLAQDHKPDLILMDIQMPVMDGYQATCIIRDELHLNIPIIAMTAHALAGEKEKCIEKGINDYLPKPFTEAELLKKINTWLQEDLKQSVSPIHSSITDLSFLRQQTRDNEKVIGEMIHLFIQQTPGELDQLKFAIDNKDLPAIYKKAHTLRNSTSLFGLSNTIGEKLLAIEKAAHDEKSIEAIVNNYVEVRSLCMQAVEELRAK